MIFNSFNFIVLFPFIFLLYYAIPAGLGRARNLFLLTVSYLLYMQWKPAYALVLLGVTVVTWLAALLLEKTRHPKWVLAAGVVLALLERMDIEATETLVVGDTTFDIEMGNRAGCKTCAVTWGNHSRELLATVCPDLIIDDLDSLYHELSN